jgi:hypothetical protein
MRARYLAVVVEEELSLADEGALLIDDEGAFVSLDETETAALFAVGIEAATVSACPSCRSRTLAAVALVDLLDASGPHPRGSELVDLADDAPTLHLYLVDRSASCDHGRWLDPGYGEWSEVVDDGDSRARH